MNHPDVNVDVQSISTLHDDIAERLLSRDDTIDLYRLEANMGILPYMRDKGYFLDLSGNKDIREFTQAMAPVFQNQMSVNGQIMGVPSFILFEYPIVFNPAVAQAIGLKQEEIPTNLLDLLKFVNRWDDEYADRFPDYQPFYATDAGSYALSYLNPYASIVLEMYKDTMLAQGQTLRYDTPLFDELLQEIEPWTIRHDSDTGDQDNTGGVIDPSQCLFFSTQAFSDEVFNACETGNIISLPLVAGAPLVQAYELECVIVNPATAHPEAAMELAGVYATDCDPYLLRILCPDVNEPYQDPNYQANLNDLLALKEQDETRLSKADPVTKKDIEFDLNNLNASIKEEEAHPYAITAKAISEYRAQIQPYLVPLGESVYESEAAYAETMHYMIDCLQGGISITQCGQQLDAFLQKLEAEGE